MMAKPEGAPDRWVAVDNYILDRQRSSGVRTVDGDEMHPHWFLETEGHALEITVDGVMRNSDCNVTGVLLALAEEVVQNLHRRPEGFTLNVSVRAVERQDCPHDNVYDPGDPENGPAVYCQDCGARLS